METNGSEFTMHRLLWEKRFLIQSMRSEKFPSGGNLVHFWHIKGREDAAYQTEKNSYANVIGHHAGQYVTVRAHNSVHAEALGDASASLLPVRAQSALQEKSIRYY